MSDIRMAFVHLWIEGPLNCGVYNLCQSADKVEWISWLKHLESIKVGFIKQISFIYIWHNGTWGKHIYTEYTVINRSIWHKDK